MELPLESLRALVDRIASLPADDQKDTLLLFAEIPLAQSEEDFAAIAAALLEIFEQKPLVVRRMV